MTNIINQIITDPDMLVAFGFLSLCFAVTLYIVTTCIQRLVKPVNRYWDAKKLRQTRDQVTALQQRAQAQDKTIDDHHQLLCSMAKNITAAEAATAYHSKLASKLNGRVNSLKAKVARLENRRDKGGSHG